MSKQRDFAVVGGGSTGPMQLIYIAKKALESGKSLEGLTFHLVDPNGFGSGGIAYRECSSNHLLNSVRGEMSPWDPEEFHQWCVAEGLGDNLLEFNKRADYGRFMEQKWAETQATLENLGAKIVEHKTTATVKDLGHGQYAILDSNQNPILSDLSVDDFVLTPGYGSNDNFSNLREYEGQGYIHSPYDLDAIEQIATGQTVAFIGAGPALYDVVNDFNAQAANPTLLVYSREGKFLQTRNVNLEHGEQHTPPDYLSGVQPKNARALQELIEQEFDRARLAGDRTDRRVALDLMRGLGQHLKQMDLGVVKEFTCSSYFGSLKGRATPVPEESQRVLASLDPTIIKQRLNGNVEKTKTGFLIDGTRNVDVIINGTGHGRHNSPIIESLKYQGLASVNPYLNVLETDETGYRLAESGIAVIGPATHFGIDGMESFAQYADNYANGFVASLNNAPAQQHENVGRLNYVVNA